MNCTEAEQFVTSLINVQRQEYLRQPKHCAVYLKRTQFFLDLIGNPEKKIPHYIHIAGTSGKGSVALMLQSILKEANLTVGCITSPHPTKIQERWQINQKDMGQSEFIKIVQIIKPKLDEYIKKSPYDMISYFELMTCISLYWFAKQKVKWAIIEAGCGGRYDSSNVIPHKDIAIITNIGLDHTEILGKTKTKIAYEKAGIIKRGNLVFTTEQDEKIIKIIKQACKKQRASLKIFNLQFTIFKQSLNELIFKYQNNKYKLQTLGAHQIKNAILCLEIAKYLKIPKNKIKAGLAKVNLPIRLEIVSKKPLIIIDSAHNPAKMKTTVQTIKKFLPLAGREQAGVNLIVGFSANKDITKMVKQLASLKPKSIACTRYTINPFRQTANPKELKNKFRKLLPQTKIKLFLDPQDALNWSKKQNKNHGLILTTGSTFLAGELKEKLTSRKI